MTRIAPDHIRDKVKQRGVITIFISMVLLLLITVLVVAAYSLSTTNLRAVGNVQMREEAISAASVIIESRMDSNFYLLTASQPNQGVDIDGDSVDEFLVDLALPICVRATKAASDSTSSVTLPGMSGTSYWNTVWELDATAREASTGVSVRVIQGVRLLMNDSDKTNYCDRPV